MLQDLIDKFEDAREWYEKRFLRNDLVVSIIIGLTFAIITYIWYRPMIEGWAQPTSNSQPLITTLYPLISSIGGTLIGFIITGVSILFAFPDSEKLNVLRSKGYFDQMNKTYFNAIKWLAATTILPVIGLVLNGSIIIFYITSWLVVVSIFRVWRCVWILENNISIYLKEKRKIPA